MNPATGKLYKDELCSQSGPQGVIVMGASAQVGFFIYCLQHRNLFHNNRLTLRSHRSGWMLPRSISQPMMMSSLRFKMKWIGLIEAGISFSQSHWLGYTLHQDVNCRATGYTSEEWVNSVYLNMWKRNHCNFKDYQNIGGITLFCFNIIS